MTVSREDVTKALELVKHFVDTANMHDPLDCEFVDNAPTIRQVLEDRLNQVDYKSLAEEMYKQ